MLLFGSELPHKHPEIHKVVICSNDKIFDILVTRLNQTRIQVYKLTQNGQFLTLKDFRNQASFEYAPSNLTQEIFKKKLEEIISEIQNEKGYYWVPLEAVIDRVGEIYGSQLKDIFESNESTQQGILNFLNKLPGNFAWHYIDSSGYYAALFKVEMPQHVGLTPAPAHPQSISQSTEVAQLVYNFLQGFIEEPSTYYSISEVCKAYGKASGSTLTEQLKGKGLGATPRKFFQNHPQYFSLRPTQDNNWEVAWVASDSV
jgi:hypothetical protein